MSREPIRQDELPPETETPLANEDDTEGHSFMEQYGRTIARDRNADAERNAREARVRDQARNKGR
jgi:hypothetical protein